MPYKNHQDLLDSCRRYRQNNKDKCKLSRRLWSQKNRDKDNAYKKRYKLSHKKQINEQMRNRRKIDVQFKIRGNLRHRIGMALQGKTKSKHTLELLGCSIDELKRHLENKFLSGMSWENYGKWHIDHIKPCASFDLSQELEQKACFHYLNLQPLWAKDNIKKGAYVV